MLMLRHAASGLKTREHLVHRLSAALGATLNTGTNLDPWVLFALLGHRPIQSHLSPRDKIDVHFYTRVSRFPSYQTSSFSREQVARLPRMMIEKDWERIFPAEY